MIRISRIQVIVAALVALAPSFAKAEDPFAYFGRHASIVSGSFVTEEGKRSDFVALRFVDEFKLADKFTGFARVDLFQRARDGEVLADPTIPTSAEALKAYSDGEVYVGAFYTLKDHLAAQCVGGAIFAMTSLSGSVGDPLDGTKVVGVCGVRFFDAESHLSVMAGHVGPVVEGGKVAGAVPSLVAEAYVPLPWMGTGFALTPDLSVGRNLAAKKTVWSTRLAISKRFGR